MTFHLQSNVKGTISMSNVHFNNPTRPHVPILKGLSVSVRPGQTLAFVGPSGCGKSTSFQLIEQFYQSKSGSLVCNYVW